MSQEIPDFKKAAICVLGTKYGNRAIGQRLDVSAPTAKKYRDMASENGKIEMDGIDMEFNDGH